MKIKAIFLFALFAILGSTDVDAAVINMKFKNEYNISAGSFFGSIEKIGGSSSICNQMPELSEKGDDNDGRGPFIHHEFDCDSGQVLTLTLYTDSSKFKVAILSGRTNPSVVWAKELQSDDDRITVEDLE